MIKKNLKKPRKFGNNSKDIRKDIRKKLGIKKGNKLYKFGSTESEGSGNLSGFEELFDSEKSTTPGSNSERTSGTPSGFTDLLSSSSRSNRTSKTTSTGTADTSPNTVTGSKSSSGSGKRVKPRLGDLKLSSKKWVKLIINVLETVTKPEIIAYMYDLKLNLKYPIDEFVKMRTVSEIVKEFVQNGDSDIIDYIAVNIMEKEYTKEMLNLYEYCTKRNDLNKMISVKKQQLGKIDEIISKASKKGKSVMKEIEFKEQIMEQLYGNKLKPAKNEGSQGSKGSKDSQDSPNDYIYDNTGIINELNKVETFLKQLRARLDRMKEIYPLEYLNISKDKLAKEIGYGDEYVKDTHNESTNIINEIKNYPLEKIYKCFENISKNVIFSTLFSREECMNKLNISGSRMQLLAKSIGIELPELEIIPGKGLDKPKKLPPKLLEAKCEYIYKQLKQMYPNYNDNTGEIYVNYSKLRATKPVDFVEQLRRTGKEHKSLLVPSQVTKELKYLPYYDDTGNPIGESVRTDPKSLKTIDTQKFNIYTELPRLKSTKNALGVKLGTIREVPYFREFKKLMGTDISEVKPYIKKIGYKGTYTQSLWVPVTNNENPLSRSRFIKNNYLGFINSIRYNGVNMLRRNVENPFESSNNSAMTYNESNVVMNKLAFDPLYGQFIYEFRGKKFTNFDDFVNEILTRLTEFKESLLTDINVYEEKVNHLESRINEFMNTEETFSESQIQRILRSNWDTSIRRTGGTSIKGSVRGTKQVSDNSQVTVLTNLLNETISKLNYLKNTQAFVEIRIQTLSNYVKGITDDIPTNYEAMRTFNRLLPENSEELKPVSVNTEFIKSYVDPTKDSLIKNFKFLEYSSHMMDKHLQFEIPNRKMAIGVLSKLLNKSVITRNLMLYNQIRSAKRSISELDDKNVESLISDLKPLLVKTLPRKDFSSDDDYDNYLINMDSLEEFFESDKINKELSKEKQETKKKLKELQKAYVHKYKMEVFAFLKKLKLFARNNSDDLPNLNNAKFVHSKLFNNMRFANIANEEFIIPENDNLNYKQIQMDRLKKMGYSDSVIQEYFNKQPKTYQDNDKIYEIFKILEMVKSINDSGYMKISLKYDNGKFKGYNHLRESIGMRKIPITKLSTIKEEFGKPKIDKTKLEEIVMWIDEYPDFFYSGPQHKFGNSYIRVYNDREKNAKKLQQGKYMDFPENKMIQISIDKSQLIYRFKKIHTIVNLISLVPIDPRYYEHQYEKQVYNKSRSLRGVYFIPKLWTGPNKTDNNKYYEVITDKELINNRKKLYQKYPDAEFTVTYPFKIMKLPYNSFFNRNAKSLSNNSGSKGSIRSRLSARRAHSLSPQKKWSRLDTGYGYFILAPHRYQVDTLSKFLYLDARPRTIYTDAHKRKYVIADNIVNAFLHNNNHKIYINKPDKSLLTTFSSYFNKNINFNIERLGKDDTVSRIYVSTILKLKLILKYLNDYLNSLNDKSIVKSSYKTMFTIFSYVYLLDIPEFKSLLTKRQKELLDIITNDYKNGNYDFINFINFMNEMVPQKNLSIDTVYNDKYYNGYKLKDPRKKVSYKLTKTEMTMSQLNIVHCVSLNNLHKILVNDVDVASKIQEQQIKDNPHLQNNTHVYLKNIVYNFMVRRAAEIIVPEVKLPRGK